MSCPTVLMVASGYPSADDPTAGRFVADLVSALDAHQVARPIVVAPEPVATWGGRALRRSQAAAVRELLAAGVVVNPAAAFRVASPIADAPGPIARPMVPAPTAGMAPDQVVADRAAALEAIWPAAVSLTHGGASEADSERTTASGVSLIHAHGGLPDGAAAGIVARRRRVPLVITEHSSLVPLIAADPRRRAVYRAGLAAASVIVCVSEALATEVRSASPEAAGRVRVVPNVVAVEAFRAAPRSERRAGELLFVGYRKPTKGIALLLEAFALALATRPGLTLRLIGPPGSGSAERDWMVLAKRLGIGDAVAFEGPADRASVAAAMARAELFVHPSPRETFGVVAAEALASGLPVVATASGGVPEVLGEDPSRVGAVVPTGDAPELASAISMTLDRVASLDPEMLRRIAVDRFSAAAVAGRLAEVYETALASRSVPGGPASAVDRVSSEAKTASSGALAPAEAPRLLVLGGDAERARRLLANLATEGPAITLVTGGPFGEPRDRSPEVRDVPGLAARLRARRAAIGGAGGVATRRRSRRLRAVLRRPVATIRELAWQLPRREARLLARARRLALEAAGGRTSSVVALDGFDALVALAVVQAGRASASPGAGRWLADSVTAPAAAVGPDPEASSRGTAP